MICPNCYAEVSEGKKFCGKCGAPMGAVAPTAAPVVPSSVRCSKCGSEVQPGKKFCSACGSPIGPQLMQTPAPLSRTAAPSSSPGPISRPLATPQIAVSTPIHAPPALRSAPRGTIGRDVSIPSKKLPSGKVLGSIAAAVIILLCAGGWYMWGVELDLITDPGDAEVVLDGKPVGKTMGQAGSLVLPHLTHGTHTLSLTHPGFDAWSQPIAVGWYALSHPLSVKLPLPSFPLTILTNPGGAKVQLDGKDAGLSDETGNLVVQAVPHGQHVVSVKLQGYPIWSSSFWIQSPFTIRADLAAAAAAAQLEIASRLERAQMLYQQRQYQAAIAECDAVLRLDSANQQATSLKSQVQQTMSILSVQ